MKETHPQRSSLQEPIFFARKSKRKIIFQGHGINLSLNNNNKNAVKKKKLQFLPGSKSVERDCGFYLTHKYKNIPNCKGCGSGI